MSYTKLEDIKGGNGGCRHCGYQHDVLPSEGVIAVGFGCAELTKNDKTIYSEDNNLEYEQMMTFAQAEELAAKDPDNDWRIHLIAPLSERHYQRQGEKHWVLYEKGEGFA